MEILFGLVVLALLVWGLVRRKKERNEWIQEERYEESGAWLDKRSGERGTYGSLDEEMEANRRSINLQGKVSELALSVQAWLHQQLPEYSQLDPDLQKRHFAYLKSEIKGFFSQFESLKKGRSVALPEKEAPQHPLAPAVKKLVLDFSYAHFPELLDLEIEVLKHLDESCTQMCRRILRLDQASF